MSKFKYKLMKLFSTPLGLSRSRYLKSLSKDELEDWIIKYAIPIELELKNSKLGGRGLFAKVDIPKDYKFVVDKLFNRNNNLDLMPYIWYVTRTIISGIGYFCNGTCEYWESNYKDGVNLGPYIVKNSNIAISDDNKYFIVTKDIDKGEELILDYGDRYFYRSSHNGIDYSKLRVGNKYINI